MNQEKTTQIIVDQTVYYHVERPAMQAIIEEVIGYINSLGDARTAVISVLFQPGLTPRLQQLLKVTVTLGGALLKETGDVLSYTSPIKLIGVPAEKLPEQVRAVVGTSLEAARAIRNHVIIEGIPVAREMPEAQTVTIIGPGLPPQMFGDPPTCPNCGHVAVNKNGVWKCLNCGESLGRVDGKNDDLSVPAATIPCPECGKTMERVGAFQKCPACGHSNGPS